MRRATGVTHPPIGRSVMCYREIAVLVRTATRTRGSSPHGTRLSEKYIVWTTSPPPLLPLLHLMIFLV